VTVADIEKGTEKKHHANEGREGVREVLGAGWPASLRGRRFLNSQDEKGEEKKNGSSTSNMRTKGLRANASFDRSGYLVRGDRASSHNDGRIGNSEKNLD